MKFASFFFHWITIKHILVFTLNLSSQKYEVSPVISTVYLNWTGIVSYLLEL